MITFEKKMKAWSIFAKFEILFAYTQIHRHDLYKWYSESFCTSDTLELPHEQATKLTVKKIRHYSQWPIGYKVVQFGRGTKCSKSHGGPRLKCKLLAVFFP